MSRPKQTFPTYSFIWAYSLMKFAQNNHPTLFWPYLFIWHLRVSNCSILKSSNQGQGLWGLKKVIKQVINFKSKFHIVLSKINQHSLSLFTFKLRNYDITSKVRSSYGPLEYFSDIFISGKNNVIYAFLSEMKIAEKYSSGP